MTRTGGMLALTTGDVEGPLASRDLERWGLICPPAPLLFYARGRSRGCSTMRASNRAYPRGRGRVSTGDGSRARRQQGSAPWALATSSTVLAVLAIRSDQAAPPGRWRPASRGLSAREARVPSPASRSISRRSSRWRSTRARVGPEARGKAGLLEQRRSAAATGRVPARFEQRVLLVDDRPGAPTADRRSRDAQRTAIASDRARGAVAVPDGNADVGGAVVVRQLLVRHVPQDRGGGQRESGASASRCLRTSWMSGRPACIAERIDDDPRVVERTERAGAEHDPPVAEAERAPDGDAVGCGSELRQVGRPAPRRRRANGAELHEPLDKRFKDHSSPHRRGAHLEPARAN